LVLPKGFDSLKVVTPSKRQSCVSSTTSHKSRKRIPVAPTPPKLPTRNPERPDPFQSSIGKQSLQSRLSQQKSMKKLKDSVEADFMKIIFSRSKSQDYDLREKPITIEQAKQINYSTTLINIEKSFVQKLPHRLQV